MEVLHHNLPDDLTSFQVTQVQTVLQGLLDMTEMHGLQRTSDLRFQGTYINSQRKCNTW